ALARELDFVYAPGLLAPRWHADGRLATIEPTVDGLPEVTRAAVAAVLESAPFPTAPVVPGAETVHDRLTIEIMRGCPRRCRFCEAGWTKGPVRRRSPETVLALAREAYAHTGYDEISLTSLSPSDHPDLKAILTTLDAEFGPRGVSLSLPSLRTNDQLELLPRLLGSVRKSGLTMVPEAGLPRLRRVIGKNIEDEHLFAGAREAWSRGWNVIKLYFMVGLPTEQPEEVAAIVELSERVSEVRREVAGGPGKVNVSIAPFVPKPHTPFQWEPMASLEALRDARDLILRTARRRSVRYKFHDLECSLLEAVLARGDRRLGRVIRRVYEAGAQFDAWTEHFSFERWQAAFEQEGLSMDFYAGRPRPAQEVLPWDHMDFGLRKEFLLEERRKAFREEMTPDCRTGECIHCGVCAATPDGG
ncbi:MAG: radical SAM protein, partial [Candidatus Brocadiae bacterium]|nr:radical SAM protein [Candidatus Brocadiia bacterium]